MNSTLHVTFFVGLFLFIITLIFQLTMYRYKQQRPFSFQNELPFELVQGVDTRYLHYHYILIFMVTLSQVIFAFNYLPTLVAWYEFLLVGSLALSAIMFYLLFFIKVFEVKKHILVVLLQALSVVTSFIAFGLFAQFSIFGKHNLVFAIVSYIIALVGLFVLFNPRLRRWPIMDKVLQQDGTVLILRPKVFLLALYEWGFILFQFILFILMYIHLYI
ncbi:MAG: hypothetical protein WC968_02015 [Bacilli bacterium]